MPSVPSRHLWTSSPWLARVGVSWAAADPRHHAEPKRHSALCPVLADAPRQTWPARNGCTSQESKKACFSLIGCRVILKACCWDYVEQTAGLGSELQLINRTHVYIYSETSRKQHKRTWVCLCPMYKITITLYYILYTVSYDIILYSYTIPCHSIPGVDPGFCEGGFEFVSAEGATS